MKKLCIGRKAPEFSTIDIFGNKVEPFGKEEWIFLSFHRFAACPFCVLRTNELIKNHDKFLLKKIRIISIWPSTKENMNKFVGSYSAPFPLVSDENKLIFKQYGVTDSSKLSIFRLIVRPNLIIKAMKFNFKDRIIDSYSSLLPADFLIDPLGKISIAHYGRHFGDHLHLDKIFQSI